MKNYFQRLCELPATHLNSMIAKQKQEIALKERDLELMEDALKLKEPSKPE